MIELLDADGDGQVSYEEFRRFVVMLPGVCKLPLLYAVNTSTPSMKEGRPPIDTKPKLIGLPLPPHPYQKNPQTCLTCRCPGIGAQHSGGLDRLGRLVSALNIPTLGGLGHVLSRNLPLLPLTIQALTPLCRRFASLFARVLSTKVFCFFAPHIQHARHTHATQCKPT